MFLGVDYYDSIVRIVGNEKIDTVFTVSITMNDCKYVFLFSTMSERILCRYNMIKRYVKNSRAV